MANFGFFVPLCGQATSFDTLWEERVTTGALAGGWFAPELALFRTSLPSNQKTLCFTPVGVLDREKSYFQVAWGLLCLCTVEIISGGGDSFVHLW